MVNTLRHRSRQSPGLVEATRSLPGSNQPSSDSCPSSFLASSRNRTPIGQINSGTVAGCQGFSSGSVRNVSLIRRTSFGALYRAGDSAIKVRKRCR